MLRSIKERRECLRSVMGLNIKTEQGARSVMDIIYNRRRGTNHLLEVTLLNSTTHKCETKLMKRQ
jgi:hypothetical protein